MSCLNPLLVYRDLILYGEIVHKQQQLVPCNKFVNVLKRIKVFEEDCVEVTIIDVHAPITTHILEQKYIGQSLSML